MEGKTLINPGLEINLGHLLRPVDPDPDFLTHLRQRLEYPSDVSVERHSQTWTVLAVVTLGLGGGSLLLWVLRRIWKLLAD